MVGLRAPRGACYASFMHAPAVFLDRDGTINEQVGYVNHPDRFWLLPGVERAIARLNAAGVPVIVTTNQAGAARGYFPLELVDDIHGKMRRLLAAHGARVDDVYYCPHPPSSADPALAIDCPCRKPRPGMLLRAARDHGIDLARSYCVGDRMGDVSFGQGVGAKGILVLTGYGKGERLLDTDIVPDFIAANLPEAVEWILDDLFGNHEEDHAQQDHPHSQG